MGFVAKLYTAEVRKIAMKNSPIENEFHCLKCGHIIKTTMDRYGEKCPRCGYPILQKIERGEK